METLAGALKKLFDEKGGKYKVARDLEVSVTSLEHYLNGRNEPSDRFYRKWKDVFKEDIRPLLEGESQTAVKTNVIQHHLKEQLTMDEVKGMIFKEMIENKEYPYKLLPREVFDNYKFVPDKLFERINQTNDELKQALVEKYERYIAILEKENQDLKSRLASWFDEQLGVDDFKFD